MIRFVCSAGLLSVSLCTAAVAFTPTSSASAATQGDDAKAVKQFVALECNKCHALERFDVEATIKSEKLKGPDLSAVGSERDAAWIRAWILKETDIDGVKHKAKWEGTNKQLDSVSDWLATLKQP